MNRTREWILGATDELMLVPTDGLAAVAGYHDEHDEHDEETGRGHLRGPTR